MLRALYRSWRVIRGDEHIAETFSAGESVIFAIQHGMLLVAALAYRKLRVGVMISEHRDGELIARTAASLGHQPIRGSTTRGGARALLAMCRVGPDVPLCLTTDGPKGPRGSVQPGIVLIAQRTGRTVLPLGFAAQPAWRASSWDHFMTPKPFARVAAVCGDPIRVPSDLGGRTRSEWAEAIRLGYCAAERQAQALMSGDGARKNELEVSP